MLFYNTHINFHSDNNILHICGKADVCVACPYGGHYSENIVVAKPNFWGVRNNSMMLFYPCYISHCVSCLVNDCQRPDYDVCSDHREGPICTQCKDGYTEALFSDTCVPNDQCTDHWVWPVIIVASMLYALALIFHDNITNMIFHVPVKWRLFKQHKQNDSTFLITLFYYFQDSDILHVSTPYDNIKEGYMQSLQEITAGLFDFRLDIFHLVGDQCVIANLSKVEKEMLKLLFLPLVCSTILMTFTV